MLWYRYRETRKRNWQARMEGTRGVEAVLRRAAGDQRHVDGQLNKRLGEKSGHPGRAAPRVATRVGLAHARRHGARRAWGPVALSRQSPRYYM